MSDNILVALRLRPIISRELKEDLKIYWKTNGIKTISQHDPDTKKTLDFYEFDKVYDADVKNIDIYNDIALPLVEAALSGINGTVFAYGQTSSGKTFTMTGSVENPGIIPLCIQDIFKSIENTMNREFLLRTSYMEIYREDIYDLLTGSKLGNLREDVSTGTVYVPGLKEVLVTDENMLLAVMAEGDKRRRVAETKMNERSSRSHSIFRLILESRQSEDSDGAVTVSHLNLVDLAGSENANQTGATGDRLKEGGAINKSLYTLSRVISQLSEGENYISFRDSKLTRILQTSLGGNAKTVMICNVTAASKEQTHSTIRFASQAKSVKNKPIINEVLSEAALLKRYAMEIKKLTTALENERNTDKAQEVEQVKEKLDEQEKQNMELQTKLKFLHEKLIVSSLNNKDIPKVKDKKSRRETWAAPSIRREFRMSSFKPRLMHFSIPDIPEELSPPSDNSKLSEELIETQDSSILSAGFQSPTDSFFMDGEMSKLAATNDFLSPLPITKPRRKRVNFCLNQNAPLLHSMQDAQCQTDESLVPKPLAIQELTPKRKVGDPSRPLGGTPREVLRARNRDLLKQLQENDEWLETWQDEYNELSHFQREEIQFLNDSFKAKHQNSLEQPITDTDKEIDSLKRSLSDTEKLYLDLRKEHYEQVSQINDLKSEVSFLTEERNQYRKNSEELQEISINFKKLKKTLEEKEQEIISLHNDKSDFDFRIELALQKQKQMEKDLRISLEEAWESIAKYEGTTKIEVKTQSERIRDLEKELNNLQETICTLQSKDIDSERKLASVMYELSQCNEDLSKKELHNQNLVEELRNLQEDNRRTKKRSSTEESDDAANERSSLELSFASTTVNSTELSHKLCETLQVLEESLLQASPKLNSFIDHSEILVFRQQLLKLQDALLAQELQKGEVHIHIHNQIQEDFNCTVSTMKLLDSICFDYHLWTLKDNEELVKSEHVEFNRTHKVQYNKFMNSVCEESFIDDSVFLPSDFTHNKKAEDVMSLADELKMATSIDETFSESKKEDVMSLADELKMATSIDETFSESKKEDVMSLADKLKMANETLEIKLQEKNLSIETLQKKLEDMEEILEDKILEITTYEEQIKSDNYEISRMKNINESLQKKLAELESILEDEKCKNLGIETLQKKLGDMEEILEDKILKITTYEEQINSDNDEISRMKNTNESKKMDVMSLADELKMATSIDETFSESKKEEVMSLADELKMATSIDETFTESKKEDVMSLADELKMATSIDETFSESKKEDVMSLADELKMATSIDETFSESKKEDVMSLADELKMATSNDQTFSESKKEDVMSLADELKMATSIDETFSESKKEDVMSLADELKMATSIDETFSESKKEDVMSLADELKMATSNDQTFSESKKEDSVYIADETFTESQEIVRLKEHISILQAKLVDLGEKIIEIKSHEEQIKTMSEEARIVSDSNETLEIKLKEKNFSIETLQKKLEDMEEILEDKILEITTYEEQIKSDNDEISRMKNINESLQKKLAELESKLEDEKCKNLGIETLQKKLGDMEEILEDKILEITTYEEQIKSDNDEISRMKNTNESLQKKLAELESKLEDEKCKNLGIETLQKKLGDMEEILEDKILKITTYEEQINSDNDEISRMKNTNESLQKKLAELESKLEDEKYKNLANRSVLNFSNSSILPNEKDKEIERLKENCDNFCAALSKRKEEMSENKVLYEEKIENLLKSLSEEEKQVTELKRVLKNTEEKLFAAENMLLTVQTKNDPLQKKISRLEEVIMDKESIIEAFSQEKVNLEIEVDQLNKKHLSLKSAYDDLSSHKDNLVKELSEKKLQIAELLDIKSILINEKQTLECALKSLQDEFDTSKNDLSSHKDSLVKELSEKKLQVVELLDIKSILINEKQTLECTLKSLQDELDTAKNELDTSQELLKAKINEMEKDMNKLKIDLQESSILIENNNLEMIRLNKLIKEYETELAEKRITLDKVESERDSLKSELIKNNSEYEKLILENENNLKAIKRLDQEKEITAKQIEEERVLKQKVEDDLTIKETKIKELTSICEELRNDIDLKNRGVEMTKTQNELKNRLIILEKEKRDLQTLLDETQNKLTEKTTAYDAIDKELDDTVNEYSMLQTHIVKMKTKYTTEIKILKEENNLLNESLCTKDQTRKEENEKVLGTQMDIVKIDELTKLQNELQSQVISLQKENEELSTLLTETNEKLKEKNTAYDAIDKELDATVEDYKLLQNNIRTIRSKHSEEIKTLKEENTLLNESLKDQTKKDMTLDHSFKNAKLNEEYKMVLEKTTEENEKTLKILEDYKTQLKEKSDECISLDKELDNTVREYHGLQQSLKKVSSEKRELLKQIEEIKNDKETQISNLITEINTLKNTSSSIKPSNSEEKGFVTIEEYKKQRMQWLDRVNKLEDEKDCFKKDLVAMQDKFAIFDGMDINTIQEMHKNFISKNKDEKKKENEDGKNKDFEALYYEFKRDNEVLKMKLSAKFNPAEIEIKDLKELLEKEQIKNRNMMRELRRIQNKNDTSMCDLYPPKNEPKPPVNDPDDAASLSCGSQIVLDLQVMRLKNANYHLEKDKKSVEESNQLLNQHLDHYKKKATEWKTKCVKESRLLKQKTEECIELKRKINSFYLKKQSDSATDRLETQAQYLEKVDSKEEFAPLSPNKKDPCPSSTKLSFGEKSNEPKENKKELGKENLRYYPKASAPKKPDSEECNQQ